MFQILEKRLLLIPLSNFHKGADLERIDIKNIHPDNKELFKKFLK